MMKRLFCLLVFLLAVGSAGIGHAQTLPGRFDLAQDPTFQKSLRVALVETAIAIAGEAASASPTVDDKRNTLAVAVLANVDLVVDRFALAVVADPAVTADGDAAIRNRVSGIWNALAGVRATD